jgi:integrase
MFAIKDRGSPRSAEKFRACMSTMFRVALGKSRKIDYPKGPWLPEDFRNPMDRVPQLAERQAFSTDLKVAELRAFLTRVEKHLHPTMAKALLLQLQTAARISEVLNLTWDELDLEEGVWTLPAARSKNGLEHRVMLSKQSQDLLLGLKPAKPTTPHVFPGFRNPGRPIRKDSTLEALRRHREALGLPEGAASHALRHTALTQLASMGCPRETRDRISNHKPPRSDMDARYNRYAYDTEAREWLQRWADRLDALSAENVVPMEARA